MFTGIITAIGSIISATPADEASSGLILKINASPHWLMEVSIGHSIAIQGACMTVCEKLNDQFTVYISKESLAVTTGLNKPGLVNLEKSLRASDSLDGHLVFGHVDGVGQVTQFKRINESYILGVAAPQSLAIYLARKGSIAVDGVSLTINQVIDHAQNCEILINLIPHTLANTTLKNLEVEGHVNLEIDMIARYAERQLSLSALKIN